ncbi:MAG TPA: hypothetical protein VKA21_11980 [Candidatus Binatia bacterium]|nr:hypothetical protein [Candidatus Binatia bacterium]
MKVRFTTAGPDVHPPRPRGDVAGEQERVAREAIRREVLLGQPDVVEPEHLGELDARELWRTW